VTALPPAMVRHLTIAPAVAKTFTWWRPRGVEWRLLGESWRNGDPAHAAPQDVMQVTPAS
jgi:hypothetical protein